VIESARDLREGKELVRERSGGLSKKGRTAGRVKADAKRVNTTQVFQGNRPRQRSHDDPTRLVTGIGGPHQPNWITEIEDQLDVPIGQDSG